MSRDDKRMPWPGSHCLYERPRLIARANKTRSSPDFVRQIPNEKSFESPFPGKSDFLGNAFSAFGKI